MDLFQPSPAKFNMLSSSDSESNGGQMEEDAVFRSPVLSSPLLFKSGRSRQAVTESPLKHVSTEPDHGFKENSPVINGEYEQEEVVAVEEPLGVEFSEEAMKTKRSLKLKRRLVSANSIPEPASSPLEESLFEEPVPVADAMDLSIPFAQSVKDDIDSDEDLPVLGNVLEHIEKEKSINQESAIEEQKLRDEESSAQADGNDEPGSAEEGEPSPDKRRKPSGRKRSEMQRETERLLRDVNITLEPKLVKRDLKSFIGRFKKTSSTSEQRQTSTETITETVTTVNESNNVEMEITQEIQCNVDHGEIRNETTEMQISESTATVTSEIKVGSNSQKSTKFLLMKEKLFKSKTVEIVSSDDDIEIMDKSPGDKLSQRLTQKIGTSFISSQKPVAEKAEKLSWKEFKAKNIQKAKLAEAKKRQKPVVEAKPEETIETEQKEPTEGPVEQIENIVETAEDQPEITVQEQVAKESDESEAEMTDGSDSEVDYGSGSDETEEENECSEKDEQEQVDRMEEEDDEDIVIPKKVSRRLQNAVIVDEEQEQASPQKDWSGFQATFAPTVYSNVPPPVDKPKALFNMFERMKALKAQKDSSAPASNESQVPAPSFDDTYERSQPAVSPTIPEGMIPAVPANSLQNVKLDEDDESLKSLKFNREQIQSMDNDSLAETSTVRSYESGPQELTMSQEERLRLQNERLSMFDEMEEPSTTQYPHTSELDLIDTLNHKNPFDSEGKPRLKRLQRATEVIAEEEEEDLKPAEKKVKKVDDSAPRQKIDFVEDEAEVEEDEYMNLGGLDGDQLEAEKILREELAAFIDEDEEAIAKMSIRELEERLMQDESVRKFFNEQLRETDLKETKTLVRDIATGKILERRKHGKTLAKDRVELDKFGRAEDEEEDENAMKELDDADYGLFGDIISKYVAMRKEAQRKKQIQKRKRADGTQEEENASNTTKMNSMDTDEYDWTNEGTIGEISIAPGQYIETDMDKLEEKIKNQSVVRRTEERILSVENQSNSESNAKTSASRAPNKKKVTGSPNRRSFFKRDTTDSNNSSNTKLAAYSSPRSELKRLSADQLRKLSPSSLYRMKQMLGASDKEWKTMNLGAVSGKDKSKFAIISTSTDSKRKTSAFTVKASSGSGTSTASSSSSTLRKPATTAKAPAKVGSENKTKKNVLLNLVSKK